MLSDTFAITGVKEIDTPDRSNGEKAITLWEDIGLSENQ